ncbi:SDR family oxidoreductase [Candidatus Poribacteria bacterium]|nr:SDR family oxidoreductase [Candidatus Poribacteria bacterium]
MRLKGQTALITGAGRGIGRAIALAFAAEGADLALASRTESELDAVAQEVSALGVRALVVPMDMAEPDAVRALASKALGEFGVVDILVNNAGVAIHHPVPDIPEETWDFTMAVNLKAPFLLTKLLWNQMVERGGGHIVNVSSVSGKQASASNATYAASKFGLVGFTEALSKAGSSVNIRAYALCPGPVATRTRAKNNPTEDPSTILQPSDVAEAALFLVTQHPRVLIREVVIDVNPSGIGR